VASYGKTVNGIDASVVSQINARRSLVPPFEDNSILKVSTGRGHRFDGHLRAAEVLGGLVVEVMLSALLVHDQSPLLSRRGWPRCSRSLEKLQSPDLEIGLGRESRGPTFAPGTRPLKKVQDRHDLASCDMEERALVTRGEFLTAMLNGSAAGGLVYRWAASDPRQTKDDGVAARKL